MKLWICVACEELEDYKIKLIHRHEGTGRILVTIFNRKTARYDYYETEEI